MSGWPHSGNKKDKWIEQRLGIYKQIIDKKDSFINSLYERHQASLRLASIKNVQTYSIFA
jgi:N-formylglutamate amidohydrolase